MGAAVFMAVSMSSDMLYQSIWKFASPTASNKMCHEPGNQLIHGHIVDQDSGHVQVWLIRIGVPAVSHIHWLLLLTFENFREILVTFG